MKYSFALVALLAIASTNAIRFRPRNIAPKPEEVEQAHIATEEEMDAQSTMESLTEAEGQLKHKMATPVVHESHAQIYNEMTNDAEKEELLDQKVSLESLKEAEKENASKKKEEPTAKPAPKPVEKPAAAPATNSTTPAAAK